MSLIQPRRTGKAFLVALTFLICACFPGTRPGFAQVLASEKTAVDGGFADPARPAAGLQANIFWVSSTQKFKVCFEYYQKGAVTIQIYDPQGWCIHREVVRNTPQYSGNFDLVPLTDGMYTFVVSTNSQKYVRSFTTQTATVTTRTVRPVEQPEAKMLASH
jgi:hypothetical protein